MKWVGGLIFVFGCYFFGKRLSKDEEERSTAVESLISLLKYMKRRMNSERTPLFAIFSAFSDEYLDSVGFLELINKNRSLSENGWETALMKLPLGNEVRFELLRFFGELGTLPLEEQLKRIDSAVMLLSDEKEYLRKELPAKQKTIKTVSLLAGLLTVIILL